MSIEMKPALGIHGAQKTKVSFNLSLGTKFQQQRRRQIDPSTCEREYTEDELEFMRALDDYKRASGRKFPTCSEILEVIKSLGYMKIQGGTE